MTHIDEFGAVVFLLAYGLVFWILSECSQSDDENTPPSGGAA